MGARANKRAMDAILSANALCKDGKMEDALRAFESCLEHAHLDNRQRFVLLSNYGNACVALARYDKLQRVALRRRAVALWNACLKIDEGGVDCGKVASKCGELLQEDGHYARAIPYFKKALTD